MPTSDLVPRLLRALLILVLALVAVLLLFRICLEAATWATYSYYFRIITSQGGVNAWLARAVSVLFAAAFFVGLRMYLSITSKQRRNRGFALLVGSFVAFNLFMYACTYSVVGVEDGKLFTPDGVARAKYLITPDGEWQLFPAEYKVDPRTGEQLNRMTPAAARDYEAWKRQKAEQDRERQAVAEEQRKIEGESRFRETYLNEAILSSSGPAPHLVLAIKTDGSDSQGESVAGHVVELLAERGEKTLAGVFKPAFYDSLFDALWDGDQSVLGRLHFFDQTNAPLLLGRATFSTPEKTDFEGLVSVQGTLSVSRIDKAGRNGPWRYTASGAGGTPEMATANCAKRLAEAVDLDAVLAK